MSNTELFRWTCNDVITFWSLGNGAPLMTNNDKSNNMHAKSFNNLHISSFILTWLLRLLRYQNWSTNVDKQAYLPSCAEWWVDKFRGDTISSSEYCLSLLIRQSVFLSAGALHIRVHFFHIAYIKLSDRLRWMPKPRGFFDEKKLSILTANIRRFLVCYFTCFKKKDMLEKFNWVDALFR